MNKKATATVLLSVAFLFLAPTAKAEPEHDSPAVTEAGGGQAASEASRPTPAPGADDYQCRIAAYESKESDRKEIVSTFAVPPEGASEKISTGEGDGKIEWKVTRTEGRVVVETTDSSGRTTLSSGVDGLPVGTEILHSKNILACDPPEGAFDKLCREKRMTDLKLKVRPKSYGETLKRIDPHAYGATRQLKISPRSYGAHLEMRRTDPKLSELRKTLKKGGLSSELQAIVDRLKTDFPELFERIMKDASNE